MEVITCHDHADFDALASILGAAMLHPLAFPLLPPNINRNLRDFLTLYGGEFPFKNLEELAKGRIDWLILVDTQNPPSLRGLRPDTRVLFIDHHPLERDLGPGMEYRGGEVGATTTLLVQELMEEGHAVSAVEATLFSLGIYEDTGSLSYLSTTPQDLRASAWLLEQGANLEVLADFLHQPLTEPQKRLYQRLLAATAFYQFSGQTVLVAAAMATEPVEEVSTLVHHLRDLHDPQAIFVLVAQGANVRLIARSTNDSIDVSEIARQFGGGGHRRAAAAIIPNQELAAVGERLIVLLENSITPAVTVGQIMSFGSHTLPPQTTVREAEEAMRRWGHEGFPVVEEGRLVGVLTRGEIDRALRHGLSQEPIAQFMHKGEIRVSPQDPVDRLQKIMIEEGVGQVPVVENGKILGIVTRTDLIKLWGSLKPPSRVQEVKKRMEATIPPNLLQVLHQASRVAQEMGYNLYLVGGFVRDLLLGIANLDIDLVVEGDAIALAKRLSQELRGRVHIHPPFGTAKIIFDKKPSPIDPLSSLDLASARTEFYAHPSALPSVERSSIKQDLRRRDFTINTLAIALQEKNFGELLDFYGGVRDLEEAVVRVLHNLSFVEDPTRILRAIRLEQRLGFRLDPRSEELIHGALPLLRRVSGERIKEELEAVFKETSLAKILDRLDRLQVLEHIHPSLRYSPSLAGRMAKLHLRLKEWQELGCRPGSKERRDLLATLYLALLIWSASPPQTKEASDRLRLPTAAARVLRDTSELRGRLPELGRRGDARSAIYRLLSPYAPQALFLHWLMAESQTVRRRIQLYRQELDCIEPMLGGDDLKDLGIPRGPIYRKILTSLRDARLDGKIKTRVQEIALARKIAAK